VKDYVPVESESVTHNMWVLMMFRSVMEHTKDIIEFLGRTIFFETRRKYSNTTMVCPKYRKNGSALWRKFQFLICALNAVFASAKNEMAESLKHKVFETWLLKLGT
jgi:hypothetical protein